MNHFHRMRGCRHAAAMLGVTLIELMIALSILAVLGIMSYRAVSAATDRESQLSAEFQRWRDIARFFQMAESDLLQAVGRPDEAGVTQPVSITPASDTSPSGLTLVRLDGGNGSVQRRAYLHDRGHIVLQRWVDAATGSESGRDVILENVMSVRFVAIGSDRQKYDRWPVAGNVVAATAPVAIEIELELTDVGTLRRLYAIR